MLKTDTHCAVKLSLMVMVVLVGWGGSLTGGVVVIDFPVSDCAFSGRIQKVSISELGRPSRSDLSIA